MTNATEREPVPPTAIAKGAGWYPSRHLPTTQRPSPRESPPADGTRGHARSTGQCARRGALLVAGLPLALLAVRRLVIEPEENYLAERYGPIYADYRRSVRPWL